MSLARADKLCRENLASRKYIQIIISVFWRNNHNKHSFLTIWYLFIGKNDFRRFLLKKDKCKTTLGQRILLSPLWQIIMVLNIYKLMIICFVRDLLVKCKMYSNISYHDHIQISHYFSSVYILVFLKASGHKSNLYRPFQFLFRQEKLKCHSAENVYTIILNHKSVEINTRRD